MRQEALIPQRRHDDPMTNPAADDVEAFFAELPRIIPALRRGRRINFVIAAFTLVAFLVVAHRTEINQSRIRDNAYRQCRLVNDNALTINKFLDDSIAKVWADETLTKTEKADQIATSRSLKQTLPVCTKK